MALIDDLLEHLSLTVKRDDLTKKILLLTCMSAYSPDPLNVFLKGESSIGKTHNAIECVKYFPKKDVWKLGALSPTALAHDFGVLEDENNREIKKDEDEKGKAVYSYKDTLEPIPRNQLKDIMKTSHYTVDLSHKILLFLEAPQFETYLRLRPILSHDDKEIAYKFTDKTARGSFSVKTAVIRGWPATIFLTTESRWLQDLVTRSLNISPEETIEKYKEAAKIIGKKYASWLKKDERLEELQNRVRIVTSELRYARPPRIFVPFYKQFTEAFPMKSGGDMRALSHYLSLIQNSALLNLEERPVLRKMDSKIKADCPTGIFATYKDYQIFHEVFLEFAESSRAGIPKKALDLFNLVIANAGTLSPEEMEGLAKKKGIYRTARQLSIYEIRHLRDAGFIREVSDSDDKRRKNWEAVGNIELVEDMRKLRTQTSLCSFSLADALTFLNEIVAEVGGVQCIFDDVVDDPAKKDGTAHRCFLTEEIDYSRFEEARGKIMLQVGLNSTITVRSDFPQLILFPDNSPVEPMGQEGNGTSEMRTLSTTLEKSSLDGYKDSAVDE